MLSSTFPFPPSRGGTEVRTFNLLKYLAQNYSVTIATQRHSQVSDRDIELLKQYVDRLVIFSLPNSPRNLSWTGKIDRFTQSWIKQTPPNVLHRYSAEMQDWVDENLADFDVVTCEHSVNEIYIRSSEIRSIVNIHSSVYGWTRNQLAAGASVQPWRDRLYLPLLKNYEKRYCEKFDRIVVTTEDDRRTLQSIGVKKSIEVIPNGVDLELFPMRSRDPSNHQLVFVGAMDADHNIDAMRFFVLEVLPQVRDRDADVDLAIVGARPAATVRSLANHPGVTVTGAVESVAAWLHEATVCVLPLRVGFGIKNKTLEAMAAGVPIVGSDRALEGLPPIGLRANRVEEYVSAIDRLLTQPDLRSQLSTQGRICVEQAYTWEQIGRRYAGVLEQTD
ncbi:glycosyltransferase family 4 protein [Microcoleus sp. FACHB-1515]|uniref:glycosyltransferase family 4 protein n=1 Tax=Cyanophyceae TaxID=3028117 RepID=UPI0028C4C21C|nr:glycosyltransferase family 4 protein [Microcoleus sp. FACHB-1515]